MLKKKEREREIFATYVEKHCKKYRDITFNAVKNYNNFKTFLSKKRISFVGIVRKAAESVAQLFARRSNRTKKNIEGKIATEEGRITHLEEHQNRMFSILQQIDTAKKQFKNDYLAVIKQAKRKYF